MNGIINIEKEEGMSSFQVVYKVRKITGEKKVGHTGTLDPLASGVLPVCIGRATKLVDYIMNGKKTYEAELKLGVSTDTYDREGKVLKESKVNLNEEEVKEVIKSFTGELMQEPPMYSALKHEGKRLYELARAGISVERKKRNITIYGIDILKIEMPMVYISVNCSKGTYIRSLCHDIGEKLGCGATMWNLKRTESGVFNIKDSVLLKDLNSENFKEYLISPEEALKDYDKIIFNEKYMKLLYNGVSIKDNSVNAHHNRIYRVYVDNKFLGIGSLKEQGFKLDVLLYQGD